MWIIPHCGHSAECVKLWDGKVVVSVFGGVAFVVVHTFTNGVCCHSHVEC